MQIIKDKKDEKIKKIEKELEQYSSTDEFDCELEKHVHVVRNQQWNPLKMILHYLNSQNS